MTRAAMWMQMAAALRPSILSGIPSKTAERYKSMNTIGSSERSTSIVRADLKDSSSSTEVQEPPSPPSISSEGSSSSSGFTGSQFSVRPDQIGAILGSSLSLPFRFGSGALVKGYVCATTPHASWICWCIWSNRFLYLCVPSPLVVFNACDSNP